MECVERRSRDHTSGGRTPAPMAPWDSTSLATSNHLPAQHHCACGGRRPGTRSARSRSDVGWCATHEPTGRLSPANGDTQFS
ncbi:MAG: hypothetical protein EPN51_02505 [Mycobacterium sp.]|nr:MAG: hypothetical protein EPN51_02505 [Mycobacterium sp.]